jgi:uncharacterized protein YcfJ
MRTLRRTALIAAAVLMLPLVGCTATPDQRAVTGGVIGAGAGALAGQAIGGNTRSTVIGAAGGAIAGTVVGAATAPPSSAVNCRFQRRDGTIFIAPCPR